MKSRGAGRSVRQRKLVVEPLESRIVLDGNVRAFVSGGSLHLQGDFHDNEILIEQSKSRSFTVSSRDGSTLINGQSGPLTFNGVRKDLDISMGKGNDVVELSATSDDPLWVVNRLFIDTGVGADQVLMTQVHALRLQINTGSGNDTLNIGNDGADGGIIVTKEAVIVTGSGQDDARIANSLFKRRLTLNLGNNNDETSLQDVTVRKRSNIIGAAATDTLNRQDLHGKFKFIDFERTNGTVTPPTEELTATNDAAGITEDATPNTVTGNVLTNDTGGTGTKTVSAVNGNTASVGTDVPGAHGTFHINADGSFTYALNNADAAVNALNTGQTLTDSMGYTASAGGATSNATLTITITGVTDAADVNNAPVRTGGNPAPINVAEDSANTTAVSLGLTGLTYGPGGSGEEASQTLTFKVTAIPAFIHVFKADGATEVVANDTLTLAELQGLTYKTVANATGTGNLTWTVKDNGGTANGGVDTLTENLAVTVNAVNDAPVRTAGAPAAINVAEDSATTTAVTVGLAGLAYGPGGGSDEASQTLTFKMTAIPAFINVFKADGTTAVAANDTLTLAELQGLTYKTVPNANGTGNLTWSVQDSGGTAAGGVDTLNETLAVTVNAINDAPSFTLAGNPPAVNVSTSEVPQTASNFASNISAGPSDEATQTLTFTLTITNSTGGLTFALQPAIDASGNLTYTPSANSSGTATVQVVLADNGSGTAPNVNQSAPQTFTITVNP
jgi:VCBS repeat-containing protein